MLPGCAFIEGRFVPMAEAKISVLDWGFLRSDATYDVVHVWQGRFFRLDRHLDRFHRSMQRLRLKAPYSRPLITSILAECVRRAGFEDAYVEMITTRGQSPTFSRDPRDAVNQFLAFAIPFGWILRPEQRAQGVHLAVSSIPRIAAQSVDPSVKNYHWLDLVMGLFGAYDAGANNVVLTDGSGHVVEGPGFNLFIVKGGTVATPDRGMLEGVTRETAMTLLAEMQMSVAAHAVSIDEVRAADEIFITSTAGGVMPVSRLDGRAVGSGGIGTVTARLIEVYWQAHGRPSWNVAVADIAPIQLTGQERVREDVSSQDPRSQDPRSKDSPSEEPRSKELPATGCDAAGGLVAGPQSH
jgi:branched-chain amino acid aminotransferase